MYYCDIPTSGRRPGPCGRLVCCRRRPRHHRRRRINKTLSSLPLRPCGAALGPDSGRYARPNTSRRRLKCVPIRTRSGLRTTSSAEDSGFRRGPDRRPGPTRHLACCPLPQIPLIGNDTPAVMVPTSYATCCLFLEITRFSLHFNYLRMLPLIIFDTDLCIYIEYILFSRGLPFIYSYIFAIILITFYTSIPM